MFTRKASPTWQAIAYGLDLLKKHILWRVGNGDHSNFEGYMDPSAHIEYSGHYKGSVPPEVGVGAP